MAKEFLDYSDRDFRDYSESREKIIDSSQETKDLLDKTYSKRRISLMLARMRAKKGYSQKDIADLTGWDKGFVSRLEGAQGGIPDLQTIAKFAEVCGIAIGIAALDKNDHKEQYFHIVDALTVAPIDAPTENFFQRLINDRIAYYPNDNIEE